MMKKSPVRLSAENITFSYKKGEKIFSDLSFTLPPGKMTVVAGSNGCGKSTLLRLLASLLVPEKGKITFQKEDGSLLPRDDHKKILGFIPQYLPQSGEMTVEELIVTSLLAPKSLFSFPIASKKDKTAAKEVMAQLDLTALAARKCASLSGGEYRRAAIAALLVQKKSILLLDEPCASLDYGHGEKLLRLLDSLCREYSLSILLVSHDLIQPAGYASKFVLMKKGCIMAQGSPEEVLKEDILEKVYDHPFEILTSSRNFPVVIPGR